ncbi:MAG: glycoside hydrolase family 88 protein [Spirochaetales bacterium]|nr:glycoside hydrolase family 88 protein [Candidatus Physcosoma equi]
MYEMIDNYIDKLMTSSPDMPLWNIESIKQGKKPAWNYIDGCMTTSLLEMYKTTGKKKYLDFVISFVDYYVREDGTILGYEPTKYSTDDVCESRILFDLYTYTGNEKYRKAILLTYSQVEKHPRTREGNFFHKAIYHDQIWLDGLFMMQPFYTRYQTVFGGKDYHDIVRQFQNVRRLMFDEKAKLYYHGYDESRTLFWANKETGLSSNFWLRAIGWFLVGLIDVYSLMAEENEQDRSAIASIYRELVDGILQYQDKESKMFYQVPNFPEREKNYLETSGSSMVSYAILKGTRLGVLEEKYQKVGEEIFCGIMKRNMSISADGDLNLKDICLVAGLGPENNPRRDGSYEYYMSEPIVENDAKGVGPFIMAYSEVMKIQKA